MVKLQVSGSTTITRAARDGQDGARGEDGNGISKVTEYYLASDMDSGITVKSSGWKQAPSDTGWGETKKYLWNYEMIEYTKAESTVTPPSVIGVFGKDGINGEDGWSFSRVEEYYLATNKSSGVTRDDSGWTAYVSAAIISSTKKYLWNYENVYAKKDGKEELVSITDPTIIGRWGEDGIPGADGKDALRIELSPGSLTLQTTQDEQGNVSFPSTEIGDSATKVVTAKVFIGNTQLQSNQFSISIENQKNCSAKRKNNTSNIALITSVTNKTITLKSGKSVSVPNTDGSFDIVATINSNQSRGGESVRGTANFHCEIVYLYKEMRDNLNEFTQIRGKIDENSEKMAQLQITADAITSTVEESSMDNLIFDGAFEQALSTSGKRAVPTANMPASIEYNKTYRNRNVLILDKTKDTDGNAISSDSNGGYISFYGIKLVKDKYYTLSFYAKGETASKRLIHAFKRTADGWYVSNNKGVDSQTTTTPYVHSYSYARLKIHMEKAGKVKFRCISHGENNYDFGILSTMNNRLSRSENVDTTGVKISYYGMSKASEQDPQYYDLPKGDTYITVKYRKDGSGDDGTADVFKFKIEGADAVYENYDYDDTSNIYNAFAHFEMCTRSPSYGTVIDNIYTFSPSEWQKYAFTFKATQTVSNAELVLYVNGGAKMYFTEVMLNEGSIALPFRNGSSDYKSMIQQTADNIAMEVRDGLSASGLNITPTGIEALATMFKFTDGNGKTYMSISVDADGVPSLIFYKDNKPLYNLGNTGFSSLVNNSVSARFGNGIDRTADQQISQPISTFLSMLNNAGTVKAYRFSAGRTNNGDGTAIIEANGAPYDGHYFTNNTMNSAGDAPKYTNTEVTTGIFVREITAWKSASGYPVDSSINANYPSGLYVRYVTLCVLQGKNMVNCPTVCVMRYGTDNGTAFFVKSPGYGTLESHNANTFVKHSGTFSLTLDGEASFNN